MGSKAVVLTSRPKTAHKWAREYSDLEVKGSLDVSQDSCETSAEFNLVCRYCCLEVLPDPTKRPYDRIRDHMMAVRQGKLKADFEKAEQEKTKQTIFGITTRQRSKEK